MTVRRAIFFKLVGSLLRAGLAAYLVLWITSCWFVVFVEVTVCAHSAFLLVDSAHVTIGYYSGEEASGWFSGAEASIDVERVGDGGGMLDDSSADLFRQEYFEGYRRLGRVGFWVSDPMLVLGLRHVLIFGTVLAANVFVFLWCRRSSRFERAESVTFETIEKGDG